MKIKRFILIMFFVIMGLSGFSQKTFFHREQCLAFELSGFYTMGDYLLSPEFVFRNSIHEAFLGLHLEYTNGVGMDQFGAKAGYRIYPYGTMRDAKMFSQVYLYPGSYGMQTSNRGTVLGLLLGHGVSYHLMEELSVSATANLGAGYVLYDDVTKNKAVLLFQPLIAVRYKFKTL